MFTGQIQSDLIQCTTLSEKEFVAARNSRNVVLILGFHLEARKSCHRERVEDAYSKRFFAFDFLLVDEPVQDLRHGKDFGADSIRRVVGAGCPLSGDPA